MSRSRPANWAPTIVGAGLDIVTVVFERELDLLALQARSLDRFLDLAFRGRILIVVNDLRCGALMARICKNVLPLYGRWRERVTLIPFHEIGHRLDPSNGWIVQQSLKLAAAHIVAAPHYVVLDAKNHLIAPTPLTRFVDAAGRARQDFAQDANHLPRHDARCARYFGLEPSDRTRRRFAPMTPFVLHTRSVRDLIRHIEAREGRRLSSFFCGGRNLSEFLLYGAYLEAYGGGIASLYVQDKIDGRVTVWPCHDERALIAKADAGGAYCFGVHRDHLAAIARPQLRLLECFWCRVGLLDAGETLRGLAADPAPATRASERSGRRCRHSDGYSP